MKNKSQILDNLEALRSRLPLDRAELFIDFVPWTADAEGWQRATLEKLAESPDRSVTRTEWANPDRRDERVLIDVVECISATGALEALKDRLDWNQLAQLSESPKELGEMAFMHPEGVPPGVFFARGNLCVSVVSFSKQPAAVIPWAERLNRRLDYRPPDYRSTISLRIETARMKVGQEVSMEYAPRWKYGEEGYLKFLAKGCTLARHGDRLVVTGGKPGEVTIDAYVLEPGRESHGGQLKAEVE